MHSTPSIGSVGITIDGSNQRVKILHPEVFSSSNQVRDCLRSDILRNHDATNLLASSTARFTARVLGTDIPHIDPFCLTSNLTVGEEARIKTSAIGLDVIYIGGNAHGRMNRQGYEAEIELAKSATRWRSETVMSTSSFECERLTHPVPAADVSQLVTMYQLCFTSYLVPLDEEFVQTAAKNSIFFVARDHRSRIVASAIGESLQVGPLTFLEISEEASHPTLRVKGAASGCILRAIEEGKKSLRPSVVAFHEARMWRNVLGIGQRVGLTEFGGVLHQHCRIGSSPEFTSLTQTSYGSLAVFYARH